MVLSGTRWQREQIARSRQRAGSRLIYPAQKIYLQPGYVILKYVSANSTHSPGRSSSGERLVAAKRSGVLAPMLHHKRKATCKSESFFVCTLYSLFTFHLIKQDMQIILTANWDPINIDIKSEGIKGSSSITRRIIASNGITEDKGAPIFAKYANCSMAFMISLTICLAADGFCSSISM